MAVYSYQAFELDSTVINGTVVADSPRAARDQLRSRGLTIEDLRPLPTTTPIPTLLQRLRHRTLATQAIGFIRELSTLLGVGVPLLEAIDSSAAQATGDFRSALLLLHDQVSEGISLAAAMKQQPLLFDDLTIHITDVGENSGNLDTVLAQLADFKERSAQFKNRVASAMIYPAIVLATGLLVATFLMTFVVPNLLATLVDAGRPLPWATQVVKTISDLIVYRGWLIVIGVVVVSVSVGSLLRTARGRMAWHRLQLRIPIVGDLIRKQAIVRVAVVLSTLLKSGIVFVKAMQIARQSTPNLVIRDALHRCEVAVLAGQDIGVSLEETRAFPKLVIQLFSVGQQSGRLEEMLDRLASDYDRQVATASQRLTAVLEPLLILVLAAIVGLIAFATILPILEAGNIG